MGNTENFELCESSSQKQCPDCAFIGNLALYTVHVSNTFAENQKVGQEELWRFINSRLRHAKEPHPWCQTWSFRTAPNALQSQEDVAERSPTQAWWVQNILKRWHKDYKYHESVADIGWTEEQIIQYDQLSLENHSKSATSEERDRTEKSWVLKLNKEGSQGPMNQGRDFVEAKREMKRLHDEHAKEISEGNTPIHLVQRSRQRRHQQCEGLEEYNFYVDAQTGWRTCTSKSQGNLSQNPTHLSSSTQWEQHDDWKSKKSWTYWRSSSWTEQ